MHWRSIYAFWHWLSPSGCVVSPQRLTTRHYVGLLILSALIGMIKLAYFLVPAIFFLIPATCFGRLSTKITVVILSIVCAACASARDGRAYLIQHYNLSGHLSAASGSPVNLFMAHPVSYIGEILATFFDSAVIAIKIDNIFTWNFCWIKSLPLDVFLLSPLILLPMTDNPQALALRPYERILALAIGAGSACVLFIVMLFNIKAPVELFGIQYAVQGRYLIPVIPFLLLAGYGLVRLRMAKDIQLILTAFLIGCLICLHYGQLTQPKGLYARCSAVMPGYRE